MVLRWLSDRNDVHISWLQLRTMSEKRLQHHVLAAWLILLGNRAVLAQQTPVIAELAFGLRSRGVWDLQHVAHAARHLYEVFGEIDAVLLGHHSLIVGGGGTGVGKLGRLQNKAGVALTVVARPLLNALGGGGRVVLDRKAAVVEGPDVRLGLRAG